MSRISVDVSSARIPVLQVGYQGENEVTDVLFDISSWITEFGEGVAQLRVKRPGNSEEESYVLSLTITDGIAVWTVSETDTFNKGNGKVQLSYLVGNIVKKAVIYPYKVGKSIVGADNPVDPFDSWIERSKAWAIGKTLGGDAVPETDETYQNNAKYYAEQADILGSAQVVLATEQVTLATEKATLATAKANAAAASEANAAASEAAVNGVSTQLTTRMSAIETEQSVQSARMDTFTSLPEGSTSGNAELADIRVGADGTTYDTAGNAVRGQISELKSDLVDIEDVTGIDTSVKKIGSATSGSSAWADTNVITNISLKAHREYEITFSVENSAHDIVYCYLTDSNGTNLVSQQLIDGLTSLKENYIPNESLSNCRLYFKYGKTTGITVNASIDYAYYPKDYVSTLMDSMVENGFTFELENKENVEYTNYFLYKLHRNANETLFFELEDKTSRDINVLATYKDGSREILCSLSAGNPKKMVTLTKELVGIGAYLPPNYTKSTLLVYGDYKNGVLDRMKTLSFENSAFGTFAKFGVIGDSLSVGYMGDSSGTAHGRNIYYSWGQVLARRYGNKCLNFGFSGATTETWYTNEKHGKVELVQEQNKCQAYVVGLGVNDTVTESNVGNANDINLSDYTQNANTFYGNYAKVLQTIMETAPTAYIFVFTIPKTKGTNRFSEIKNNAIKGVVAKLASDRVFVIETNEYSELFNLDVITDNSYSSHYTAIGYANIATINAIMLSDCMNSNADKLKDIAFIPYGNNDVIN